MKLLFLDFDGVLNSAKYIKRMDVDFDNPKFQVDPEAVIRVNAITECTGACIVVSSTWRNAFVGHFEKLQECLLNCNITGEVVGATPSPTLMNNSILYCGMTRSEEIRAWLHHREDVESYVVLDDEVLEGFDGHHLKTLFEDGIQDHHVRQAILLLGMK